MKKEGLRRYRHGLRVACLTTFMSGFINTYTYLVQGGKFSGMQTGNLLLMMVNIAQGELKAGIGYLLPIGVFILGQFFTYYGRVWARYHQLSWSAVAGKLLFILLLGTAVTLSTRSQLWTLTSMVFFSSIMLESFRTVRGVNYANIMMTGNLKNASTLLVKGIHEKNSQLRQEAYYIGCVLLVFMVGVAVATVTTSHMKENSIYLVLLPLLLLNMLFFRCSKSR